MENCHFCQQPIAYRYFRVGSVMACPDCVAKQAVREQRSKWTHFQRGLLFAILAAIAGVLVKFAVEMMLATVGSNSLFSAGAYLRGFTTVLIGYGIGAAAIKGANNRSCRELQVSAILLTYLAYTMAIVPFVLSRHPFSTIKLAFVLGVVAVAPFTPFLAVLRSPVAITGLIVLAFAMRRAWMATAPSPETAIDGPFDATDRHGEKPMFGGVPT